jgi:DNA polymerase III alpha subunit/intein/homing endonuclease
VGSAEDGARRAAEMGHPALAMTEHGVLSGVMHHIDACREVGITPIVGCECYYRPQRVTKAQVDAMRKNGEDVERFWPSYHMVILAKDIRGWRSLMLLTSEAWRSGLYRKPCVDDELLDKWSEGLFISTSCVSGYVPQAILRGDDAAVKDHCDKLDRWVGENWYGEIQPHDFDDLRAVNLEIPKIMQERGRAVVAKRDAHVPDPTWIETQHVSVKMRTGESMVKPARKEGEADEKYDLTVADTAYIASSAQTREDFQRHHPHLDLSIVDQAIENTGWVASQIAPWLIDKSPKMPLYRSSHEEDYQELRRQVYAGLERLGHVDDQRYIDAVEKELKLYRSKHFCAFFLIIAEMIKWLRSSDGLPPCDWDKTPVPSKVPEKVGLGRGCLTGDVNVWTSGGFKRLVDVKAGDKVMTSSGAVAAVKRTFSYEVDEEVVRVKSFLGDSEGVAMTRDHKVLVERATMVTNKSKIAQGYKYEKPIGQPEWVEAGSISPGDLVCVPVNDPSSSERVFDLADFAGPLDDVREDVIVERRRTNLHYPASRRDISLRYGINTGNISRAVRGLQNSKALEDAVKMEGFTSIRDWCSYIDRNGVVEVEVPRFVSVDGSFADLFGFWASNGWLRFDSDRVVGWAERRSTSDGSAASLIERVTGIAPKLIPHRDSDLLQLEIRSGCWARLIRSLVPGYEQTAQTKYIPDLLMRASKSVRSSLLSGLWRGDGSTIDRNSYTTSSERLMYQVRTLLWSVGVGNGVSVDDRVDIRPGFSNRSRSWKIVANRGWDSDAKNAKGSTLRNGLIMTRVRSVESERAHRVYDLEIDHDDHSYLTSSFAVHNSAGGCCVAYVLRITIINPIAYDFSFERFLNPDRSGLPDIDIDLTPHGADLAKEWLKRTKGKDKVYDMIAHATFGAREALRRVGMVYDIPHAQLNALSKTIDDDDANTPLELLREHVPEIDRYAEQNPKAFAHAARMQKGNSKITEHAAGVVVSDKPLDEIIPVMKKSAKDDYLVTAFGNSSEKETISDLGLLKLDLLVVVAIARQAYAEQLIGRVHDVVVDLDAMPWLEDPYAVDHDAMNIFVMGAKNGIFQWDGKSNMASLTKRIKPDAMPHLAAANAGVRPGVSQHAEEYVRRRHGGEFEYWDPSIEPALKETFGLPLYQEQIMKIFELIGGYSPSESDTVRRIMGKYYRRKDDYAQQLLGTFHDRFVENAASVCLGGKQVADQIWEYCGHSATYLFNRIHAFEYACIAMGDAWLKAHYPDAFYASLLTFPPAWVKKPENRNSFYERNIREARSFGLDMKPPDVNESDEGFTIHGDYVRFGLKGIKGLGPAMIADVLNNRPFYSIEDMGVRLTACNAAGRHALAQAGAMDRFGARTR